MLEFQQFLVLREKIHYCQSVQCNSECSSKGFLSFVPQEIWVTNFDLYCQVLYQLYLVFNLFFLKLVVSSLKV